MDSVIVALRQERNSNHKELCAKSVSGVKKNSKEAYFYIRKT
jgi:hypothetical protein